MVIRTRLYAGLTFPTCPSPVGLILVIFKGSYQCETALLSVPYMPITVGIPVIYITGCGRGKVVFVPSYYIFKI